MFNYVIPQYKVSLPQFGEVSKFKNNYDAKYFYFLLVKEHVNRPRSELRDSGVVQNF